MKSALVEMRQTAGLTQRELAERLRREHSFVWRIENGERRVDLLEFYWICRALSVNASDAYRRLAARFESGDQTSRQRSK